MESWEITIYSLFGLFVLICSVVFVRTYKYVKNKIKLEDDLKDKKDNREHEQVEVYRKSGAEPLSESIKRAIDIIHKNFQETEIRRIDANTGVINLRGYDITFKKGIKIDEYGSFQEYHFSIKTVSGHLVDVRDFKVTRFGVFGYDLELKEIIDNLLRQSLEKHVKRIKSLRQNNVDQFLDETKKLI